MLEVTKKGLLVDGGVWFAVVKGVYLGRRTVDRWRTLEDKISWVINPKIRVYLYIKMIRGDSLRSAMNKVFSKYYWKDPDYLAITK